ncbi:MAG: EAL domain-containing protein, partial [Octadecabacter sp.]
GYEALCRFSSNPYRAPNHWFDDAQEVGLLTALEVYVIEIALQILPDLPAHCYLAVNTSPATLATGKLSELIAAVGGARVVVEVTEHNAIDDLDVLLMEIDRLRDLGVRIAVDDAGAGYSGLQQIIRLRPDVIKLDMSLTHDVDKDVARRALASAMVQFARDTNARVVAEGIETEAELRTLKRLGVEMGQGYHLGRPALSSVVLKRSQSA